MKNEKYGFTEFLHNAKNSDDNRMRVDLKIDDIVKSQFELLLKRGYGSERLMKMVKEITSMHEIMKVEDQLKKEA